MPSRSATIEGIGASRERTEDDAALASPCLDDSLVQGKDCQLVATFMQESRKLQGKLNGIIFVAFSATGVLYILWQFLANLPNVQKVVSGQSREP